MNSVTWKVVELSSQTIGVAGLDMGDGGARQPPLLLDVLAGAVEIAALEQHRLLGRDRAADAPDQALVLQVVEVAVDGHQD